MQGLWRGVLPSLVMVSNPTVNYMLYEYLRARLEDWRAVLAGAQLPALPSPRCPCLACLMGPGLLLPQQHADATPC